MTLGGDLRQRAQPEKVLVNMRATLLISGKRKRLRSRQRRARQHDFEGEAFQQRGAQFFAALAAMQAGGNQFIKQGSQRMRWKHPRHFAGGSRQDRNNAGAVLPVKSTKYFTSGSSGAPVMCCGTRGP